MPFSFTNLRRPQDHVAGPVRGAEPDLRNRLVNPPKKLRIAAALSLAVAACDQGVLSKPVGPDPMPGGGPGSPMAGRELAPARVRRLSADEIHNSIRDVFFSGDDARAGTLDEGETASFDNRYDDLTVYLEMYTGLDALAQRTADGVVSDLARILPCGSSRSEELSCARSFLTAYGRRLYRRPLSDEERDRLLALYESARAELPHADGIGALTLAMLLSPRFLFRTELGAAHDDEHVTTLTSYERAAALSYYLWRSTPDDTLLAAAAADSLLRESELRAQLERMLQDPRAKLSLREFFFRWLQIEPTHVAKSDDAFTPRLAESMQRETELFIDNLLFSGDRRLSSLWLSSQSFVDAPLSTFYGVTQAPSGATQLPRSERAGVLTQASFIASHTPADEFSPIFVGALIRRNVLCQQLLDPPAGVPEAPNTPGLSVRERLAEHQANPACATCHSLMDPIGFAFEQYSPSGKFAPSAEARALSGEANLTMTDVEGKFFGAVELSKRLAESRQVRKCFVANVLQYLLGRETSYQSGRTKADVAAIEALMAGAFADDDMLAAFTEAVLAPPFFLRDASALPTPSRTP